MRKIEFDLTENESMPRYRFAGFEGEHNATLLTVLLPERMRKGTDAEYRFLFETASGEAVFSAALPLSEEGALSVSLTRSLMVAPELKAYVGCYVLEEGEPILVAKSGEMVLGVQRSLTDESGEMDHSGGEVPGLVIDAALSAQSRNPVENRAVYAALEEKAEKTDFNRFIPRVNEALKNAEEASTYANQTAYRAQIAAQDAIQATADASQAATNAENSMLTDAFIDEDGVLFLQQKGYGNIYVGKVKGDKGDPGIADNSLSANAIKGKKSGEVVALTDVSPLEHEMKVKASQGGATLKKYSLNVFDSESSFAQLGFQKQEDGSWLANNYNGHVFTPPVGTKQMFFRVTVKSTMAHHVSPFNLRVYYKDEPTKAYEIFYLVNTQTDWIELSGFSDASRTIDRITFSYGSSTATRESYYIKDVIFSYADAPYEPYVAPTTYTAVGETVDGIIGNGGSMTLIPDTAGVTIEAEYNRDTNKVIENLMEKIAALENAAAGLI